MKKTVVLSMALAAIAVSSCQKEAPQPQPQAQTQVNQRASKTIPGRNYWWFYNWDTDCNMTDGNCIMHTIRRGRPRYDMMVSTISNGDNAEIARQFETYREDVIAFLPYQLVDEVIKGEATVQYHNSADSKRDWFIFHEQEDNSTTYIMEKFED